MKFEDYNIHDNIKKGLAKLGFRRPTDIQYKAIPTILKGEDLLAVAQTGTGKTAAFAIPTINKVYYDKLTARRRSGVKCIVLAPTHELADQIAKVFNEIAKYTTLHITAVIGGVDQEPQIKALNKGSDIVIATPGRMFDLISQGWLITHSVETLILDEADYMLDLGFIDDITDLIRKLPKRKQTLFFSATINQKIKKIAYSVVKQNAIRIQLSPKDPVANKLEHYVMHIDMDHKRYFLERVRMENPDAKILVFVRTKIRAERVKAAMARVEVEATTIHGDKEQEERTDILAAFRAGESMMLIATDITARGIDIPDISIVINYDLPLESENYVHRVGRTGRANRKGYAYSFCAPQEKPILDEIQGFLDKEIQVIAIDKLEYNDTLNIAKDRTKDIAALVEEIESFEKRKKKKKKKK